MHGVDQFPEGIKLAKILKFDIGQIFAYKHLNINGLISCSMNIRVF